MFGFTLKKSGVAFGLKAHKEYSSEKVDSTKDWLKTRPWRTTLTVSVISAVLLYLFNYPYFMLAVVCLGVYLITSLRWQINDENAHLLVLLAAAWFFGMFAVGVINNQPGSVVSLALALIILFLVLRFEQDRRVWLHVYGTGAAVIGHGWWLGANLAWLGLLFPAAVYTVTCTTVWVAMALWHIVLRPLIAFMHTDWER